MTTQSLRAMRDRRPFSPFVLHLADGRDITVTHPENIAYAGGRTAVVVQPNDHIEIIDLLLVTGLEGDPLDAQPGRRDEEPG